MTKPKPKRKRKLTPPTLNAIYRQQLLLRDAVKALTTLLTDTQARCERLQFDKGVLAERVLKAKAAARVPTPNERDEDLAAVQRLIDQVRHDDRVAGAVLAYNAIMALTPMTATEVAARQSPAPEQKLGGGRL